MNQEGFGENKPKKQANLLKRIYKKPPGTANKTLLLHVSSCIECYSVKGVY